MTGRPSIDPGREPPHISQEEADEYALGVLEPGDQQRISGHIAICPVCASLAQDAENLASHIALAAPARRVPPAVKERVLAETRISRPRRIRWMRHNWQPVAAAAAAILAIAAISGVVALWNRVGSLDSNTSALRSDATIAASNQAAARGLLLALVSPNSRMATMKPASAAAPASGQLVWNDQQHICWITFDKLPTPPAGEAYQLWVQSDAQSWSLGTFRPDASGMVAFGARVSADIGTYESAVITLGPTAGASTFSGNALYTANLGAAASEYK